jgi:hypothetical protein
MRNTLPLSGGLCAQLKLSHARSSSQVQYIIGEVVMAGKGSKQRPTDQKKFDKNYERIFGKKNKVPEKKNSN